MENYDFSLFKGEIILKDDKEYNKKRMCWNRGINKRPLAIAYCENIDHLKQCIKLIKLNSLQFRIRSGAHHYEGFSTGDNVFVIDVSKMNKIKVNLNEETVEIQAGTRNRELYEALGKFEIPFPGGGCPTVGAVGYTLGGGWGYSSRHLGLGIDSLISAQVLNYKGEIINAKEKENSDLFWALKGAGAGNFGIVISMKFKIPKKESDGTLIVSEINKLSLNDMANIFEAWDKNIESLDEKINMKIAFYNDKIKGLGIKITGIYYGNKEDAKKELNKILLKYNWNVSLNEKPILDINRWIQDNHPDYEKYKSTGRFVKETYTKEEILEILEILNKKLDNSIYVAISLYGLCGKIRDKKNGDDSFFYRNAKGILGFQSMWEEDCDALDNKKWVVENFNTIKRLSKGSFVSFPLGELDDYMNEYFGEYKEKIKYIKSKYDPDNFFDFEQGIL